MADSSSPILRPLSADAAAVPLSSGAVVIGRADSCDVTLPDAFGTLSRRHCRLLRRGASVRVEDLSRNGTFVNGRRVGRGRRLALGGGDILSLAHPSLPRCAALSFRLEWETGGPHAALLAGRYALRGVIGCGGAAVVRDALDRARGVRCAVKRFRRASDFAAELSALRRVSPHAHIVRLLAAVREPPALVLERCETDLAAVCAPNGLAEGVARGIAAQLVDALRHAHTRGVAHGDLSPPNVLLTRTARGFGVRLADFGGNGRTAAFSAPEVRRGAAGGAAADVWSLGAVLHCALCGRPPGDGPPPRLSEDGRHVLRAMLEESPTRRIALHDVAAHPWMAPERTHTQRAAAEGDGSGRKRSRHTEEEEEEEEEEGGKRE